MAIVSISSGLNNLQYGEYQYPIKEYLERADLLAQKESLLGYVMPIEKADKFASAYGAATSLKSRMTPVGENGTTPVNSFQDDYDKVTRHDVEWRDSVSLTMMMIEDGQIGPGNNPTASLIENYHDTREELAAAGLTAGNATSFTYTVDATTYTFNVAGGDSKALFATDHSSKTNSAYSHSNLFNTAFDNDALTKLEAKLAGQTDGNGRKMRIKANQIIVPFATTADAVQLQAINEALNADGNPNSANRAGTYNAGRYEVVPWNFLGAPSGITSSAYSWFILADKEFVKKSKPFMFHDRIELMVDSYYDHNTKANNWDSRARFKYDTGRSWRGVLAAIPGVGSTL